MAWKFPEGCVFDLITSVGSEYLNCRFIERDEEHVVIERDHTAIFGRVIRLRTQVRLEDVRSIHEHAISAVLEAFTLSVDERVHARPEVNG